MELMRTSEVFVPVRRGLGRALGRLGRAFGRFLWWRLKKMSRKALRA